MLQKRKRNAIFEAIESSGLDLSEFDLDNGEAEARIDHLRSASYFLVGEDGLHYVGTSVVGDGHPWPYEDYTWQRLISRISGWAADVKRDVETPDLWAELRRDHALLGAGPDAAGENTPFTLDERDVIGAGVRVLRDDARRTCSLSDAQLLALETKIDYLVEAAGHLGRIDWRNVVVGTMFAYALEIAVPPDCARVLVYSLLRSTAHFYAQGFGALPGH